MDDRRIPRGSLPVPLRGCEISRLQSQLLAQAYQRVCPEIRRKLGQTPAEVHHEGQSVRHSTAARTAAGA